MSLARTAPPVTPQTPATPAAPSQPSYTPNGSWKHPDFDEIARRQYATTFDERNVRAIVANAGLLFLSIYANAITSKVTLLHYAAYAFSHFPNLTGQLTMTLFRSPINAPRNIGAIQRVASRADSSCLRRQHRHRLWTPRSPLLSR